MQSRFELSYKWRNMFEPFLCLIKIKNLTANIAMKNHTNYFFKSAESFASSHEILNPVWAVEGAVYNRFNSLYCLFTLL